MKEGWTYKKLGEVAEVSAGQGAPQGDSNYSLEGTPFVKAGNLSDLINGVSESSIQKVSEEVAKSHKLKLYKAGSVLFAKSGMSCMKGFIYTLKSDCYVVSHLAIITPYSVNSHFLNYYLRYNKPNSLIKDEAYPSISLKDIENLQIPFPPIAEQERIVAELDLLSGVIEKKKEQLKAYDQLAQSIFYTMFGDPITNEKGWDVKSLNDLSSLICNGNTPKGGSEVYVEKGVLFLRSQNVWKNRLELEDVAFIDEDTHSKLKKSALKHNDLLITKTGRINTENSSLGRTALFEGKDGSANINGHVYLVRLKQGVLHKFVLYILISESYRELIRKTCVGGIDKRQLNRDHIENFPIILPPSSLQLSFIERVEAIERQKALVQQSIDETQTMFDYTMDKYFG